jgi:hypothetical protein
MKGENIKRRLFLFILAMMLLPLVQTQFHFIESGGLFGDFSNAENINFSWKGWWDGSYQKGKTDYINDQFGFRPDFLRINNQIDYWLFRKLHSNSVVMGKNNCLYQTDYIKAYCGKDYIGADSIRKQLARLKALQDTLERLGKTIIVVHTPCKASFYPDNFPEEMECKENGISNFQTFKHIGDSLHINQIDFNSWYAAQRYKSKALLYSKQGIHWTVYGSLLVADSLTSYIEHKRNITLPHITWSKIEHTHKAKFTDADIAQALNLIFPVTTETFSYPDVHYTNQPTNLKTIYSGDSFVWTLISDGWMEHTNKDWQFWYYFHEIKNQKAMAGEAPTYNIPDYDWKSAMTNTDCIILLYTAHNLCQFGNGFIEQAYNYYYPNKQ